jgi:eukaryotic-like serine/threonine-protein kinase
MPSASVAAFLELARELRLLSDADLAPLADTPDAVELPAVCDRLVAAGRLTRYQADRILTGRGYTLAFAGYPLLDELDANTFRVLHPAGGSELRLKRFTGGTRADVDRVRLAVRFDQPGVSVPLAVETSGAEVGLLFPQPDGADLAALVADMGPMPALLAAEYTRQAAVGLSAAHAAGAVHAHVRADRLFVGPLVQASKPKADGSPRLRPGPTATVTVADFGLPGSGTAADNMFAL